MRALIIVDVQHDFLPGGALAVPQGDEVIPVIEKLAGEYDLVITTADQHPPVSKHFERWPVHCVAGTRGAEVHQHIARLRQPAGMFIEKGQSTEDDGYSGFDGIWPRKSTVSLERLLAERGVDDVTVVGLALDYCVKETALDAKSHGYRTKVVLAATRPVAAETGLGAVGELRAAGVEVI